MDSKHEEMFAMMAGLLVLFTAMLEPLASAILALGGLVAYFVYASRKPGRHGPITR